MERVDSGPAPVSLVATLSGESLALSSWAIYHPRLNTDTSNTHPISLLPYFHLPPVYGLPSPPGYGTNSAIIHVCSLPVDLNKYLLWSSGALRISPLCYQWIGLTSLLVLIWFWWPMAAELESTSVEQSKADWAPEAEFDPVTLVSPGEGIFLSNIGEGISQWYLRILAKENSMTSFNVFRRRQHLQWWSRHHFYSFHSLLNSQKCN